MKILIIDNNLHIKTYPQGIMIKSHLGFHGFIHSTIIKPTQLNTIKANHFDRIILSGSTAYIREEKQWMTDERHFIDRHIQKQTPILGICFGAQLLARHLFGKEAIEALPFPINGSIRVTHTGNKLFSNLPNPLPVVATHYEGFRVPSEYLIAETKEWPSYGFHVPDNIFGIQFHPELNGFTGKLLVKIQRLLYDRTVHQDFSIPTEAKTGTRLLKNFLML